MRVLAIDQGTTSTRGIRFDADREPVLVARFSHRQIFPRPRWVEHDPREILAHVRACIDAAGPVDAIGIANQGESCLAWDALSGEPLSPIMVWQDDRSADRVDRIRADGHAALVTARTGLPLDSYFSASKLGWLVEELPEVRAAHRAGRLRLGTTDSFLIERLTGEFATDAATASRTALMDLHRLEWDPALCALFGVPIEALPPIKATNGRFGMCGRTPITASIVDQQAALFGHGARRAGDAKITLGTGAFALVHAGRRPPEPDEHGLIASVAWSDGADTHYALEGGVYDAGAALEWLRRIGLLGDDATLGGFEGPPAIEQGLAFVPALSGLACPYWRRDARGLWAGMTGATTRDDLQRSVLEGIALQICTVLAAIDTRVPLASEIPVDGGIAANDHFLQFLADASGRTISRQTTAELTAYGVACMAGHAHEAPAHLGRFEPRTDDSRRRAWKARYRSFVERALP